MLDGSWDRIVDALDERFGLTRHGRYDEPLEDKPTLTQHIEFIEFERGDQEYRLERRTGPAIVDRKTIHHKAAGSSVRFENVYDATETTHKIHVYTKTNSEWTEINASDLSI